MGTALSSQTRATIPVLNSFPVSWATPMLRAVGLDWKSRGRRANRRTFRDLIACTNNFATMRWLGHPIWQNVLDLWTIQETLAEVRPALLIEGGTHRGGSARSEERRVGKECRSRRSAEH